MITAEDYEKVGNHSGLPLFIEGNHIRFVQALKSHLDHADGTVDDHLTGVDNSSGLLSLEHCGCNLGSVCKVGDSGFYDAETCDCNAVLNLLADSLGYDLAGTTKAALIGYAVTGGVYALGHIVRIDADDVTKRGVALQRQILSMHHVTAIPISTGVPRRSLIF